MDKSYLSNRKNLKFFSKFFKKKSQKSEKENSYLPKKKAVIEERFILKFIENGGKFLYCENLEECLERTKYYLLKISLSCLNDLNSKALPKGSLKNFVFCSPGSPSNLTYGSITNSMLLDLIFSENKSN